MSTPASVLVALDESALRSTMAEILRGAGHRAIFPESGRSLAEACRRSPVDVVALEPGSPELPALREAQDLPYMPVLLVSLQDREEERAAGLRDGADDCVGIDVPEGELLARLEALARVARLAGPVRGELAGPTYLKERLAIEFERAERLREPLSILLARGGDGGDVKALADRAAQARRRSDPLARCEGGALAVILRNTHFAGATVAAQRIQAALEDEPTLHIGVACQPSQEVRSAGELYALAHKALERARKSGPARACVVQNELLGD